MSVICRDKKANKNIMFIKGAPDYLLKKSLFAMNKKEELVKLDESSKAEFENKIKEFAKKGLRTLAICMKINIGDFETYSGPLHPSH